MTAPSRSAVADEYLGQLPYEPYPVQEDALLKYFTSDEGVLVCAPTGTGKTLIAEAALYEALRSNTVAYYTTPLIALTEQKFAEMQDAAERWGFPREAVGLVTGHRKVNPRARVLVVVAEILLNRLLKQEEFAFDEVSAVVMDEFHTFADPERGIVWELSLSLLPRHVRLLLLSATVGNANEFRYWLRKNHGRDLELAEGRERRVPLTFYYVHDRLLGEHLQFMADGTPESRKTPALVFVFSRDDCWALAEQVKGLHLLGDEQRRELLAAVAEHDWSRGAGNRLKELLVRGIGIHHAGILPRYRRVIEELYGRKLLPVCFCTETLAAGINLPARSVVLTTLVKGAFGKQKLIDPSTAHQIFGRAGRPQYDKEGFVYCLAPEDDVKILRWKEKYDQIPENTKDPGLLKAKKALKKKQPTRNATATYWNEPQFEKLKGAPPTHLASRGPLPWRVLANLLTVNPSVESVRRTIGKRFLDPAAVVAGEKHLDRMLLALAAEGFVRLDPPPPVADMAALAETLREQARAEARAKAEAEKAKEAKRLNKAIGAPPPRFALPIGAAAEPTPAAAADGEADSAAAAALGAYRPTHAHPLPKLRNMLAFRSVHPVYGAFLAEQLATASREEKIQAMESVLELPRPVLRHLRVPPPDLLPPGPLATEKLDPDLIARGLIAAPLPPGSEDEEDDDGGWEERPPGVAEKLKLLFDATRPLVTDVTVQPAWAAGALIEQGGDFDALVRAKEMVRQEGILFRHVLRMILLCEEFSLCPPAEVWPEDWQREFQELADGWTAACRKVDPTSTDEKLLEAHAHRPAAPAPAAAESAVPADEFDPWTIAE